MRVKTVAAFFCGFLTLGLAEQASAQIDMPKTFQDCLDCPEMVVVPAGSVEIGSPSDRIGRKRHERDRVVASIPAPFALAETEVTLGQYRAFVEATGHVPEPSRDREGNILRGCNYFDGRYGFVATHGWDNPGFAQRENEPVVCVSYFDAVAYAAWLSEKTGRAYRLPSAVEFEFAARAGSTDAWPWGNDASEACDHANLADWRFGEVYPERDLFPCRDRYVRTAPAGSFPANGFGLHDMIGNAWEWTADCWRDNLEGTPVDGSPVTEAEGGDCSARTPMGGGWISGPGWARLAVRSNDPASYRSFMLGFRVASEAP